MSTDTDLFGAPATPTVRKPKGYTESNDMEIVQYVITTAMADGGGYALVGPKPRVLHLTGCSAVEPVPPYEAAMVCQLVDRRVLTTGGAHTYYQGSHELRGRSVLVPKATASMARRWQSLAALPHQRPPAPVRSADTGKPSAGRLSNRTSSRGASRGLTCPECGERAQRKRPTRWPAANGSAPAYSHLDGQPLCPVMGPNGYRPAEPRPTGTTTTTTNKNRKD